MIGIIKIFKSFKFPGSLGAVPTIKGSLSLYWSIHSGKVTTLTPESHWYKIIWYQPSSSWRPTKTLKVREVIQPGQLQNIQKMTDAKQEESLFPVVFREAAKLQQKQCGCFNKITRLSLIAGPPQCLWEEHKQEKQCRQTFFCLKNRSSVHKVKDI